MALNGNYLSYADSLLATGDYTQASEKYWGAMAEVVKAVAEKRGWQHSSHRDLRNAISRLHRETGDGDILRLFAVGESLHANFYEDFLAAEDLRVHAGDARAFVEKLRPIAV